MLLSYLIFGGARLMLSHIISIVSRQTKHCFQCDKVELILLCHIGRALFRVGRVNGGLSFPVAAFENAIELGDIRDPRGEQLFQGPFDVRACQQR